MAAGLIQIKRIPLIVVLWEGAGFHGRKRTLPVVTEMVPLSQVVNVSSLQDYFNSQRDLGLMAFDDTTNAVGIHAGPTYGPDEAIQATISFFEDPEFGGTELALPPGNHPDLDLYGFAGRVSSWRYNPPGTRVAGKYKTDGTFAGPIYGGPPSKLISPIPLVVQLFNIDFSRNNLPIDAQTGYPDSSDVNQNCVTLVEDTWDLRVFGPEFDQTNAAVVWLGPDYNLNPTIADVDNWHARLYEQPLTDIGNEPAHRDLSPKKRSYSVDTLVAPGVFDTPALVGVNPRGVRFVKPGG